MQTGTTCGRIGTQTEWQRLECKDEVFSVRKSKGNAKEPNHGVIPSSETAVRPGMAENVTPHLCDCINVKLNKYTKSDYWSSLMSDSSYHLRLFIFTINVTSNAIPRIACQQKVSLIYSLRRVWIEQLV
jgi:hypothetical protein